MRDKKIEKDVRQIFLGEGNEELTAELIDELVKAGMPKKDLLFF